MARSKRVNLSQRKNKEFDDELRNCSLKLNGLGQLSVIAGPRSRYVARDLTSNEPFSNAHSPRKYLISLEKKIN